MSFSSSIKIKTLIINKRDSLWPLYMCVFLLCDLKIKLKWLNTFLRTRITRNLIPENFNFLFGIQFRGLIMRPIDPAIVLLLSRAYFLVGPPNTSSASLNPGQDIVITSALFLKTH